MDKREDVNNKDNVSKAIGIYNHKYQLIISICLSAFMFICLLIHLIWPGITVDNISLYIIAIAVLPWIIPLFRSIKLPGGIELEPSLLPAKEKERISDDAEKAGLINKNKRSIPDMASKYHELAKSDVKLALASLRIDIEERLKRIAETNQISIINRGLIYMLRELQKRDLVDINEVSVISDIAGLLNRAVHSDIEHYDFSSVEWALDLGSDIVTSLDRKICTR